MKILNFRFFSIEAFVDRWRLPVTIPFNSTRLNRLFVHLSLPCRLSKHRLLQPNHSELDHFFQMNFILRTWLFSSWNSMRYYCQNCYEQSFGAIDDDKEFAARMKGVIMEAFELWERAAGMWNSEIVFSHVPRKLRFCREKNCRAYTVHSRAMTGLGIEWMVERSFFSAVDVPDKRRLTALVALTTFHQLHFGGKDKKMVKTIWGSHKKVRFPGIKMNSQNKLQIVVYHLVGDLLWSPCSFLLRELPLTSEVADKKTIAMVNNALWVE